MEIVTVTVQAARLVWDAPTENTDGTPIGELAGFRVHVGTRSRTYDDVVEVADGTASSYVVEDLERDRTYYFAVTAVDRSGRESRYSNEASKTIP
jgi:hypothetical protein